MTSHYALDKTNARLMGVCSGLANRFEVDPLPVRVTVVLAALILGPIAVAAYLLTGLIANRR